MKKSVMYVLSMMVVLFSFYGCFKDDKTITSFSIISEKESLIVNEEFQLATLATYSDKSVEKDGAEWSSSATDVVSITQSGKVKGLKLGSAVITAVKDGQISKLKISVVDFYVEGTGVADGKATIISGKTITLKASSDGVTWSSDNVEIATVDANGVVTTLKPGKVTITAKKGTFETKVVITVKDESVAGKLRIHYHRFAKDYDGWGLHLWNEDAASPAIKTETAWAAPILFDQTDDYGMYADIEIVDITKELNFIIHKGDTKDVSADRTFPITGETEFWLMEGKEEIYLTQPALAVQVKSAEITGKTTIKAVFTGTDSGATKDNVTVKDNLGNTVTVEDVSVNGINVTITTATLDLSKNYTVEFNGVSVYSIVSRELLQNDTDLIYNGTDLGATLNADGSVTLKLWTPPATAVKVYFYDKADQTKELGSKELAKTEKGVWAATVTPADMGVSGSLDAYYYQYEVTAYGATKRALDPYAKSMAAFKGNYISNDDTIGKAAVVDLNSTRAGTKDTKLGKSIMANNVDMVVYEVHVRDFSISNTNVPENLRGTFTGFKDKISYLKDLGITHVQFLPVQNHYRVNETDKSYQDENQETPNFNWGYDPHSYFSLEGWYSTDANDPYKRIEEFRDLVKALHEAGIGVIVDVVYNHTMMSTIFENVAPGCYHRAPGGSAPVGDPAVETRNPMVRKLVVESLKMLVDDYGVDGFRFDLMGFIDSITVQEIRKTLGDDIVLHGEAWNFTDLPEGTAPVKGITDVTEHGVSDLGFFNDTSRDSYAGRMAGLGYLQGQYFENAKAKAGLIGGIKGFTNGGTYANIDKDDYNLFAVNPDETLQFLTIHDGFTLWDKINLSYKGTAEVRAKMVKQATAMLFTSQGKIIIQGGAEIARTKPLAAKDPESGRAETSDLVDFDEDYPAVDHFHENTYRSSDYTNEFKWGRYEKPVFKGIYDYYKGLIEMRRKIPALRFKSADSIKAGMKFIGDKEPEGTTTPENLAGYKEFSEMAELTIKFKNGPVGETYYFAGEVHKGDANPAKDNPYVVVFDAEGNGSVKFTKENVADFDLAKWGATAVLNFKLVKTMGKWDAISGAYTGMGNNNIYPQYVEKGDTITVDLKIVDHTPGEVKVDGEKFIAYELDNTIETAEVKIGGTAYTKLIVVHNADTEAKTIDSTLITNPAEWIVIMDEDEAGVTAVKATEVKIEAGKLTVPANSSAVIAK